MNYFSNILTPSYNGLSLIYLNVQKIKRFSFYIIQIYVLENQIVNREWTIQTHRLYSAQDKQTKNKTQETKNMANMDPLRTGGVRICSRRVASLCSYETTTV